MPQFEILECSNRAVIKVLGVGGGGNNAVEHMLTSQLEGVEFICANTDAQVLKDSEVQTTLQFGDEVTDGLGAGADPQVGRQAAVEDRERAAAGIDEKLSNFLSTQLNTQSSILQLINKINEQGFLDNSTKKIFEDLNKSIQKFNSKNKK